MKRTPEERRARYLVRERDLPLCAHCARYAKAHGMEIPT